MIFNDLEEAKKSPISEDELSEELTKVMRDICKHELEPWGYEQIEYMEEEQALRSVWREFLAENAIESDLDLCELAYSTQKEKGMTQVWDGGDSTIGGLWVRLPEVIEHTREVTYYTFAE
ncbi:MAG: hypothetical protein AB7D07_10355 [Desulfovibrionaceae bacterium]